ncbi:MAG: HU family DNA-binding protein [Hydrogenophilales bacterium]|nr:HU family DNA-binding protein [Hydrogenophilales bacterium]
MNLNELITAIQQRSTAHKDSGLQKNEIEACLRSLGDVATEQMKLETGEIPLPGLGKLKAATRAARKGVNPATGAEIDVPAKNTAKFVPSKALLDAIA